MIRKTGKNESVKDVENWVQKLAMCHKSIGERNINHSGRGWKGHFLTVSWRNRLHRPKAQKRRWRKEK